MAFDKYIGIDWSGAKNPIHNPNIQVAEYYPATNEVTLVAPPQNRYNNWSRNAVLDYMTTELGTSKKVLIGLDFAFAYPHCDMRAYFPNLAGAPANHVELWEAVEQRSVNDDNLYGASFIRDCASPFRDYHLFDEFHGASYVERFRTTDLAAHANPGVPAISIFHCVGAMVGPGSVAGMRLLRRIRSKTAACIWPFDRNCEPDVSTVVEIYPRVFLKICENAGISRDAAYTRDQCDYLGATLLDNPDGLNVTPNNADDRRDALVSAAGLAYLDGQGATWTVPVPAAMHEGWIFGV